MQEVQASVAEALADSALTAPDASEAPMYEQFTDRARRAMQLADREARRLNHEYIGTEHLLLGLVAEGSGVAANVLKSHGADLARVRLEVERLAECGPDRIIVGKLPETPRVKSVIEYAFYESQILSHDHVGTGHLLLGLLRDQEGVAAALLASLGFPAERVRTEVVNSLAHDGGEEGAEGTTHPSQQAGHEAFDATLITRPDRALMRYYVLIALLTGPAFPITLLPLLFKYETLKYRFDASGVSMSWGVLWRREIHLTYRRIQDIHLTRNIIQRWMGLATVAIQTASGSAGAEMSIEGVLAAGRLRDYLYAQMRGARGDTETASTAVGPAGQEEEALGLLREIRDLLRRLASRPGGES